MARMYSRGKGRSGSKRPPYKMVPKWVKYKKKDVEELVINLSKEGNNSAVIGTILRDQYGISDVKTIAEKSVVKILMENKLYGDYPQDLLNLFTKAIKIRGHMTRNKHDKRTLKGLEHLESKIRRLIKFYSRERKIPDGFQYDPEKVKLIMKK